ncbi:hypothetical protein BGX23_012386 [Mortierella sp. AD031]|nr:hypothetical protein BGX23_012386 [Mortierella sp. AD031]KAG0205895.1 hypothetical protein BGX33_007691 [Mortierella sp. NVP41]
MDTPDHTSYYISRCQRRLAMLDSEEAFLLLDLKTPHMSSAINHPADRERLRIVRESIFEYELSLQSLYSLRPNKMVPVEPPTPATPATPKPKGRRTSARLQATSSLRLETSPCDMTLRYKRRLIILDEEEREFISWGLKQNSPELIACRQLIRRYEKALMDFVQMDAETGVKE